MVRERRDRRRERCKHCNTNGIAKSSYYEVHRKKLCLPRYVGSLIGHGTLEQGAAQSPSAPLSTSVSSCEESPDETTPSLECHSGPSSEASSTLTDSDIDDESCCASVSGNADESGAQFVGDSIHVCWQNCFHSEFSRSGVVTAAKPFD